MIYNINKLLWTLEWLRIFTCVRKKKVVCTKLIRSIKNHLKVIFKHLYHWRIFKKITLKYRNYLNVLRNPAENISNISINMIKNLIASTCEQNLKETI